MFLQCQELRFTWQMQFYYVFSHLATMQLSTFLLLVVENVSTQLQCQIKENWCWKPK